MVAPVNVSRKHRLDFPALYIADQIGKNARRHDGCAGKCQITQVKRAQIEIDHRSSDGPRTGIASAARDYVDQGRPPGPANHIGDHAHRVLTQGVAQGLAQVRGRAIEDDVWPARGNRVALAGRAQSHDRCAAALGELNQRTANTARGARHQHGVAGRYLRSVEHVFCGDVGGGKGCQFGVAQVCGNGVKIALVHRAKGSKAAVALGTDIARSVEVEGAVPIAEPRVH